MGWDFTGTPYDEDAWGDVAAAAAQGPAALRARLEQAIPPAERNDDVLELLEAGALADRATAWFLEHAARGAGVFLGRSTSLHDLSRLADGPLAEALGRLAEVVEPVLSGEVGDAEQQRHRWTRATVAEIAAHAERLDIPALTSDDVERYMTAWRVITGSPGRPGVQLTDDHPAVKALGSTAAAVMAVLGLGPPRSLLSRWFGKSDANAPFVRLLLGYVRGARDRGHGLVWSHDGLGPRLRIAAGETSAADPTLPDVDR